MLSACGQPRPRAHGSPACTFGGTQGFTRLPGQNWWPKAGFFGLFRGLLCAIQTRLAALGLFRAAEPAEHVLAWAGQTGGLSPPPQSYQGRSALSAAGFSPPQAPVPAEEESWD